MADWLAQLPAPPADKYGWPWTNAAPALSPLMPNGQPWPRITVITPSYHQGRYLEETLRSVLLQNYPNLEYFVIDGGSEDESRSIMQRYAPWLSDWVSEKDNGQAHAINKGLQRATGEILNWINSDDLLMPGALAEIALSFVETQAEAVAAACINFGQGPEKIITNENLTVAGLLVFHPATTYHQPAVWLRRPLLLECGGIDEHYHYVFDWEMTLRYLSQFPKVHYLSNAVARFRLHAESKTTARAERFEAEHFELWRKFSRTLPSPTLRTLCDHQLRRKKWLKLLNEFERDQESFRLYRAAKLSYLACLDPAMRFTRMTAGAIRRHLLNQYAQRDLSVI
ncbi:MAG: glycosyltransferase [Acidobacteria bacterium]|nr:glycosyltransferase [Acidobacteriota bacterium]